MNRIRSYLNQIKKQKLLIPFITAGYPDSSTTLNLIKAAIDSGCDMIEIGFPFSDPLADGAEVQFSSYHALKKGMTLARTLRIAEQVRKTSDVPLILMGYYNPVLSYGENQFMKDATAAGVDGLIIPDLPVVEASDYKRYAAIHDISTIFLAAPTTDKNSLKQIEKSCSDFVYAVTVTGVTGGGKVFGRDTDNYLKGLGQALSKKFVAGFGISSPETARRFCKYSDGVVIGSKLISLIRSAKSKSQGVRDAARFLSSVRRAI
ncbi:MAG: tryptophan synthase subunit alpha [candidate division Zixibacteria bacterium]|nr:tryptophan synthase subunit alpha [candidate division Zixibacteria bacterium]